MSPWGLPEAIRHGIADADGLNMHFLEAGSPNAPLVLLLHGFPELSYSWRKVILPLSAAGYRVVAPDLRGYGRTCPGQVYFDDDLTPYRPYAIVRDVVALVYALRAHSVFAVVGHDHGSLVAGNCALIRPDLFKRVVCMSAPYTGAPTFKKSEGHHGVVRPPSIIPFVERALHALHPPREHYTVYFSGPSADRDMTGPGLHAFLRAYYHVKSADWSGNGEPHALSETSAEAVSVLPEYYVMLRGKTMPKTVLAHSPSLAEVAANRWLPEDELAVYVSEYARTSFQGGLNGYRCITEESGRWTEDLLVFSCKTVDVPSAFIAGKRDWGVWQFPGAVDIMKKVMTGMGERFILVDGAGHWVQQEKPAEVVEQLLSFFKATS
ncbi:epoxide hydrolase [Peniophora sp. CONT]|nr:epoxide hydrolase [Peniophora sp. CONT]